jgi:hypothetical protein
MSVQKFISAGLLTATLIASTGGQDLHREEQPSPVIPTTVSPVSSSGSMQYWNTGAEQQPSSPRLVAIANRALQKWFWETASSESRFVRASLANMVPQSRLRSFQSRSCYSASSQRRI